MSLGDLVDVAVELRVDGVWRDLVNGWVGVDDGPVLVADAVSVRSSGRSDWSSQVSPGSISLTLDNTSGLLSPGRADSPFHVDFRVGAALRVRARWGGDWVSLGVGEIVSLGYTWPSGDHGGPSYVDVEAAGLLSRLRRDKGSVLSAMSRGVRFLEFQNEAVAQPSWTVGAHWPMEASTLGAEMTGHHRGVPDMRFTGGDFSGDDLPGSDATFTYPAGDRAGFRVQGPFERPDGSLTTGWMVSSWMKVSDMGAFGTANTEILTVGQMGSTHVTRLYLHQDGVMRCSMTIPGEATVIDSTWSNRPMPSGEWCLVWVASDIAGGDPQMAWGWQPLTGGVGDTGNFAPVPAPFLDGGSHTVAVVARSGVRSTAVTADVSVGHVTIAYGAMRPVWADMLPTWRPVAMAHEGEQARDRVDRMAAESATFGTAVDIVTLPASPELTTAPMGPQPIAATWDIVEEAVEAGQAMLVEDSDDLGLAAIFPEQWYNRAPAVVLDAEADEISIPFSATVDIQAQHEGTTANLADQWSIDNLDAWLGHMVDVDDLKSPTVTVTDFPGDFLAAGTPGSLFEVDNLPAAQIPQRSLAFRAEQISHQLTRGKWVATVNTSSGDLWRNIGVWDDPDSLWDGIDTVLWSAMTVAHTSAAITRHTLNGHGWASPITVRIEDEHISLDVRENSPPEYAIFLVTRGVDGTIPAAHPAGTPVQLVTPVRWAY